MSAVPPGAVTATAQATHRGPLHVPAGLVLAAPVIALMALLLVAPLALMFRFSFHRFLGGARFEETFTLANYTSALTDGFYLSILLNTLALGLVVTAATLVLGYPLALAIVRTGGWAGALITALVVIPLMTSVIVRTYGWIVLLGTNGLVNRFLVGSGLMEGPVRFLFDLKGVLIGLVHVLLPFMILAVASSLRHVDPALEEAARNLGASPVRAFLRVTLPLSMPGVLAGSLLVFVLAISAFVTPSMMGGERVKVMAMLVYEQALGVVNWPLASTLSMVLLVVALAMIGAALALAQRGSRWRGQGG